MGRLFPYLPGFRLPFIRFYWVDLAWRIPAHLRVAGSLPRGLARGRALLSGFWFSRSCHSLTSSSRRFDTSSNRSAGSFFSHSSFIFSASFTTSLRQSGNARLLVVRQCSDHHVDRFVNRRRPLLLRHHRSPFRHRLPSGSATPQTDDSPSSSGNSIDLARWFMSFIILPTWFPLPDVDLDCWILLTQTTGNKKATFESGLSVSA